MRIGRATRCALQVLALALMTGLPSISLAQGFQFTPALSLLGSVSSNPLLLPGSNDTSNLLLINADLPFQFRGPRWSGSFTLQPGYQKHRGNDNNLDTFTGAGQLDIEGRLSPRSSFHLEGDFVRSSDLLGQIGTDIVLPRQTQFRGNGEAILQVQLTPRDSISFTGQFQRLDYSGGDLIGNRAYGAGVGYARALSPRLALTTTALGQLVQFDTGDRARSLVTTAGFSYRLTERTDLSVEGGLLWIQQDLGQGFVQTDSGRGFSAIAKLTHSTRYAAFALTALRDMGFTNGLGVPTIRTEALASVSTGRRSWNLVGLAGFSRNENVDARQQSPDRAIDTWTGCISGGLSLSRNIAAVSSFLFAHQIGGRAGGGLDVDSYRAAFGLTFRAAGRRSALRAGQRLDARALARRAYGTC